MGTDFFFGGGLENPWKKHWKVINRMTWHFCVGPGDALRRPQKKKIPTVDGWNPAKQLRLVAYPIIYRVFLHPRWWWCRISSINSIIKIKAVNLTNEIGGIDHLQAWLWDFLFFCLVFLLFARIASRFLCGQNSGTGQLELDNWSMCISPNLCGPWLQIIAPNDESNGF